MSYYRMPSGSNLVLNVLAGDGNSTKFPLAYVYTEALAQIAGSPFPLTHVAQGLYSNLTVSVSDGRYTVVYVFYDDLAHTTPSIRYNRSTDTFDVNDIVDVNAISQGVWRETVAGNVPAGSFGEAISQVSTGTVVLQDRLTSSRATSLDNLDATVSSRASAVPTASQVAAAVWDEPRSGHAALGSFGECVDVPVSSRESESDAANRHITDVTGHNAEMLSLGAANAAIAALTSEVGFVKGKTDQLAFSGPNVLARAAVVDDKTNYALTLGEHYYLANFIWDEPIADHLTAGSTGKALSDVNPALTWDAARSSHHAAGSFGEALQGVLSSARAIKIDNLDVAVSSRESETNAAGRASTNQTEHDATQAAVAGVSTKLGTPAGVSVSADLAAVKTDTAGIAPLASDVLGLQGTANQIVTDLGYAGGSVAADMGTVKTEVAAIKGKTDQLTFGSGYVNANTMVNGDKTGYTLTPTEQDVVVDKVWNEAAALHSTAGSTGKALQDAGSGTSPTAIADAVWDEAISGHTGAGSFGNLAQLDLTASQSAVTSLADGTNGLAAIKATVVSTGASVVSEVNQNEVKIDAILPALSATQAAVVAEVNQNEVKIDATKAQVLSTQAAILAPLANVDGKCAALLTNVAALQNNTTVRFIVPERIIKPTTGSKTYQFHLRLYDELGHAEAPDVAPTIRIRRLDTGVDIVSGASMTQDGAKVGAYFYNFVVSSSSFVAPVLVEATLTENTDVRYIPATTEITEFESDLTAVEAAVAAVDTKVSTTNTELANGVYGLAALKSSQSGLASGIASVESGLGILSSEVMGIPTNPALSSDVTTILGAIAPKASISQVQTTVNLAVDELKGVSDKDLSQVYAHLDLSTVAKTADPRFANLDAPVSTRSTLTASQVWAGGTRTLTGFSLATADINAIWDHLSSQAVTPGSIGKRIVDLLDTAVSTRAATADVVGPLAGVAQEATVLSTAGNLENAVNANEIVLLTIQTKVNQILSKTGLLPADPASQASILSELSILAAVLADIELKAGLIKTKTDALPVDPAKESSVQARPVGPLLASDVRLNALENLDIAVSSVVPADISNLATKDDLSLTEATLGTKSDELLLDVSNVQLTANQIKTKVDALPVDVSSTEDVTQARDAVLARIDANGSPITPSQIWNYGTRYLTQDPGTFGPDISNVATKDDVSTLAKAQYSNKMSTVFIAQTGKQEVIVWAEKDGSRVVASSTCVITVNDSSGALVWQSSLASPNADGVYRFENTFTAPVSKNYYIVISIVVDGSPRVSQQSFFTMV